MSLNQLEKTAYDLWRDSFWSERLRTRFKPKSKNAYTLLESLYQEGLTPRDAMARVVAHDIAEYQREKAEMKSLASAYQGLTRSALNTFIKWSSSRYNEYQKHEVVDAALEMLVKGEGVRVYTAGTYTEKSGGYGWDYLINGDERYIVCGYGSSLGNFQEKEPRLYFPLKAEKI